MLALAAFVSQSFGGSNAGSELETKVKAAVARLRNATGHLWLDGLIKARLGVCRHRSILFKYLCDHMCLHPAQWGLVPAATTAGASASASAPLPAGAILCQLVRGVVTAVRAGVGDGKNEQSNEEEKADSQHTCGMWC